MTRHRLLAALALLTAGCAATPPGSVDGSTVQVPVARPPGMQDPAPVSPAPTNSAPRCDPRRSFRPIGALPAPRRMPAGTRMAQIFRNGRLRVGVDQTTNLFGLRDPETSDIEGFDVDIAHEITRAIFGDPEKIQLVAMPSGERIPQIKEDHVDIVVHTMTMTCERWNDVNFSTEYFRAGQRVLVNHGSGFTDIGALRGKKVCADAGTTSIQNIANEGAVPVAVRDWTDCMVLLQQGQVDAISTDNSILAGLQALDLNTEVVGEQFSDEPYGIAISKDADDLTRFVNGVLDRMRRDGTWQRLYDHWLRSALGPVGPPEPKYRD